MRHEASLAVGLVVALAGARAHAADALSDDDRVLLHVDVEGSVRVQQDNHYDESCTAPCSLRVPRRYLHVTTPNGSTEIFVSEESRVTATTGSPAVRRAGLVTLIAGGAVVALAVGIPLLFCVVTATDHPSDTSVSSNPCRNVSDPVKVAWISGAGIGLAAAIVGGTFFALSGPQLRVTDAPPTPRVAITPILQLGAHSRTGSTDRVLPGLALTVSY